MPFKGYKHSAEHDAKISQTLQGHGFSPETLAKMSLAKMGERSPRWKGGRYVHPIGYVFLLRPNHPYAVNGGYVLEHRLVMEERLGRLLLPTEVVHHINGIKGDNRDENLMRFDSENEHRAWHKAYRKSQKEGKS